MVSMSVMKSLFLRRSRTALHNLGKLEPLSKCWRGASDSKLWKPECNNCERGKAYFTSWILSQISFLLPLPAKKIKYFHCLRGLGWSMVTIWQSGSGALTFILHEMQLKSLRSGFTYLDCQLNIMMVEFWCILITWLEKLWR